MCGALRELAELHTYKSYAPTRVLHLRLKSLFKESGDDALSPVEPGVLAAGPRGGARTRTARVFGGHCPFQGPGGAPQLEGKSVVRQASTQQFVLNTNKSLSLVTAFFTLSCSDPHTPSYFLFNNKNSRTEISHVTIFLSNRLLVFQLLSRLKPPVVHGRACRAITTGLMCYIPFPVFLKFSKRSSSPCCRLARLGSTVGANVSLSECVNAQLGHFVPPILCDCKCPHVDARGFPPDRTAHLGRASRSVSKTNKKLPTNQ